MPDKPLEPKDFKKSFDSISQRSNLQDAVDAYFSQIFQSEWKWKTSEKEIWINTREKFKTGYVLRGHDGSYVAIVEFRDGKSSPSQTSILDSLLCATDTRFGIRVIGSNPKRWDFCERQGANLPSRIECFDFSAKLAVQAKEAACPVFKGEVLLKKKWDEYSKTWKNLKAKCIWRVTEIFHPDCPFTPGKELSDAEYQKARESYPGCSVKKGDIITKAELAEHRKTWPELASESVWRVTEVFHPEFQFKIGDVLSDADYYQARKDYLGCLVKKGDILTKAELTEHRKTCNNLKSERIWCITDTDYQQAQDKYDRSQSKIKFWQLVTAGAGFFLLCFGVLFLIQRSATEDAVHRNAVLANQLIQKESEVRRKELVVQQLTSSVQTLKGQEEALSLKIRDLERQLGSGTFPTDTTSGGMASLSEQLSEQRGKNQGLQNQLVEKDAEIQQLQNDKAVALNENRRLQNQLVKSNSGTTNQNATVRRLQKEKTADLNENQQLQAKNADFVRQNQELRNENEALQNQLDNAKQGGSSQGEVLSSRPDDDQQHTVPPRRENLIAEPPETVQNYREIIPRAGSHNNQGCLDFERSNYDEAVKQFEQAIKADSKFAVAHYNLGCVYLEMREYRKAISAFGEAVAINDRFKEAYYNLGFAHLKSGAREAAKSSAELALKTDRNYQPARNLLAAIEKTQR